MQARLISITQPLIEEAKTAEQLIVYCARVSSPQNQGNVDTGSRLLRYCINNKHWSIFEQASMTIEVKTSRAIAAQILRHNSFRFQEFSQRYSAATECEPVELRMQGDTSRQGGEELMGNLMWEHEVDLHIKKSFDLYNNLIEEGVAKESARFILPLATTTTLYMTGNVRSWIFYFAQRLDSHAQKEHRELAGEMFKIFSEYFPETSKAMENFKVE